jgi:hypothetical protein
MNRKVVHLVTRLYPRAWRERYGDEFEALLLAERGSIRTLVNVTWSALREHCVPVQKQAEAQCVTSFGVIVKQPSAAIPVAMSLAALVVIFVHIVIAGIAPEPDEGPAAHIWQLLMAAQIPVLLFFAIKWLPRAPRLAVCVLALQVAAIAAAMAPVFLLHW